MATKPPGRWRDMLSADPAEHDLLVELRTRPDDVAVRAVYGDWLEQHRDAELAGFVRAASINWQRDAVLGACDAEWRAVVARHELASPCPQAVCPRAWHRFLATSFDERRRDCIACLRRVRYCEDAGAVRAAKARGELVVLDLRLDIH